MVCTTATVAAVLFPNSGRVAGRVAGKFANRRFGTLQRLGISVSGLHGACDSQGVAIFEIFFRQQSALDGFVS